MRPALRQASLVLLAAAVLALAFFAYLRPAFVVDLANRFWMCL